MKIKSAYISIAIAVLAGALFVAFPNFKAWAQDGVAAKTDAQSVSDQSSANSAMPSQTNKAQPVAAPDAGRVPDWRNDQDKAVEAARAGHYDVALPALEKLRSEHPESLSIATDYAAILGWAGRDADAVAAYEALPAGNRPDYLIDAIGHSYRNLHKPEQALAVYRLGLQSYPTNQSFVAGEILSLSEAGQGKEAVSRAEDALNNYPTPSDALVVAIKQAFRSDAVAQARAGKYEPAIKQLDWLHKKYPSDNDITSDYMSVLDWAGNDKQAVALYETLPKANQPAYILNTAAHAYRTLHQPKKALELYRAALDQEPDNVTYAIGVIDCMIDMGQSKEALAFAKSEFSKHKGESQALNDAYRNAERNVATELARTGHYDIALEILRDLRKEFPSDSGVAMDYIAVLSWSGHNADAVSEYIKIANRPMPDYVLAAVGHSYRELKQSDKALIVYRRGRKQSPLNETFVAGEIRCLDDLARYAEGEDLADEFTRTHGDHLEVLLAGGEASNLNDEPIEALNFYERAEAIDSKNHEALQGLVRSEDRLGAPQLAMDVSKAHPGVVKDGDYSQLVGDYDSALVRWETLEPTSESERNVETDQAIATLDKHIADWTAKDDPKLEPSIDRARFDRLIALRDRSRMQDVVDEYNGLVDSGIEVPTYALNAVGEAYLYLRQPEIARDIFLKVLSVSPDDYQARRLLSYAYLECNQYDEAYQTVDKLVDDQAVWIYLKGEPERQPDENRAAAELDAGLLRSYGDLLDDADTRVTALVEAAPYDARNRAAAGNIYLARGWPRKALEEYEIGNQIQEKKDLSNEVGIANANLELHNYQIAEAKTDDLAQRFPESLEVANAVRDQEIYNMYELDAHAGYNFAPSESKTAVNIPHGQGYDVGAELYSAPIDYNWRLFAGQDFAHEHEPNGEGKIDYARSNAGIEYRNGDVTASVAPTLNLYNSHPTDATVGDNERVGAEGQFKYTFNDYWTADIAAELFSQETPLRALNAGVTANYYNGGFVWRESESRELLVNGGVMTFSDDNVRTLQNAEYIERLYTAPTFKLDADGAVGLSQDSKNEERRYYNPASDLTFLAGLRGTQTLYHYYDTLYEHSLMARAGMYSEQHYGTTPAWDIRYEHRLHLNKTFEAGLGVDYLHQDYDGLASDAVSLTADLVEHF